MQLLELSFYSQGTKVVIDKEQVFDCNGSGLPRAQHATISENTFIEAVSNFLMLGDFTSFISITFHTQHCLNNVCDKWKVLLTSTLESEQFFFFCSDYKNDFIQCNNICHSVILGWLPIYSSVRATFLSCLDRFYSCIHIFELLSSYVERFS